MPSGSTSADVLPRARLAPRSGCSVSDLTGQPYLAPDRQSADAMTMVPGVELAIHDCTLDDVPDMPARPIAQLVNLARQANAHCDETQYALSGRDFGAVLSELHIHVATGDSEPVVRRWPRWPRW